MAKKQKTLDNFKSLEEYEKYIKGLEKTTAAKEEVEEVLPVENAEDIWRVVNYYKSERFSFADISRDARNEKKFASENMAVFLHDHNYGKTCTKKCREEK